MVSFFMDGLQRLSDFGSSADHRERARAVPRSSGIADAKVPHADHRICEIPFALNPPSASDAQALAGRLGGTGGTKLSLRPKNLQG
jgi:hypothetical protein